MSGPTALDYSSMDFWLDVEDVARADWWQVTTDVQSMEAETLRLMRDKN